MSSSTVIRRLTSTSGLRQWPLPLPSSMRKLRTFLTDADPTSHRVRLWRGGSASSLFFYLFFYSFVEHADIDTSTLFKGPWSLLWCRGGMADLWPDRFSLCLRAAVLSVCSLLLIMFLPCRLIIDPAGSVGPRGTGSDSDWKLVLLHLVWIRTLVVRRLYVPVFIDYMTTPSAPLDHAVPRVDSLPFGLSDQNGSSSLR